MQLKRLQRHEQARAFGRPLHHQPHQHQPRKSRQAACRATKQMFRWYSEMVDHALLLFIFQQDLGVQLQRALNKEEYDFANTIREKRDQVRLFAVYACCMMSHHVQHTAPHFQRPRMLACAMSSNVVQRQPTLLSACTRILSAAQIARFCQKGTSYMHLQRLALISMSCIQMDEAISRHNAKRGTYAGTLSPDVATGSMDTLSQQVALQSQLNEAIEGEDYAAAAKARDELSKLKVCRYLIVCTLASLSASLHSCGASGRLRRILHATL